MEETAPKRAGVTPHIVRGRLKIQKDEENIINNIKKIGFSYSERLAAI